ncbi:MAG: hypothetical protein AAF514_12050 [Verrucomicrobiota bacterium]
MKRSVRWLVASLGQIGLVLLVYQFGWHRGAENRIESVEAVAGRNGTVVPGLLDREKTNPDIRAMKHSSSNVQRPGMAAGRGNPKRGLLGRLGRILEESADFEMSETLEALRALENHPDSATTSMERAALLARFVELSPETAVSYGETLFGDARMEALSTVMNAWTAADPEAASFYLMDHLDDFEILGSDQRELAGEVAGEWVRQDPDQAVAWVEDLPLEMRGEAYERVLGELVAEAPDQAVALVGNLEQGFEKTEATDALVEQWAWQDPQAAAEWVESGIGDEDQSVVVGSLVHAWIGSDPMAASEWIGGLERGSLRDGAIKAMTQSRVLIRDPEASLLWVSQIDNEALREPLLDALVRDSSALPSGP